MHYIHALYVSFLGEPGNDSVWLQVSTKKKNLIQLHCPGVQKLEYRWVCSPRSVHASMHACMQAAKAGLNSPGDNRQALKGMIRANVCAITL